MTTTTAAATITNTGNVAHFHGNAWMVTRGNGGILRVDYTADGRYRVTWDTNHTSTEQVLFTGRALSVMQALECARPVAHLAAAYADSAAELVAAVVAEWEAGR